MERLHWEQATSGPEVPLAEPLLASFATLPEHYQFVQQLAGATRSDNRLAGGDCENLAAMQAAGWRHFQHRQAGQAAIDTLVEWTPRAAHAGAAGLLLRAAVTDEKQQPPAVETPPVWITTAGVGVEAGDLVQIQAWVRINAPITGSIAGLVILDTQSGEPLALRLGKTEGWRQVTFYRAARQPGTLAVTFALAGLGEAAIDDVSVAIVRRRYGDRTAGQPVTGACLMPRRNEHAALLPQASHEWAEAVDVAVPVYRLTGCDTMTCQMLP